MENSIRRALGNLDYKKYWFHLEIYQKQPQQNPESKTFTVFVDIFSKDILTKEIRKLGTK